MANGRGWLTVDLFSVTTLALYISQAIVNWSPAANVQS
jgi:hypothetical protein